MKQNSTDNEIESNLKKIHVVHIVHAFVIGGFENGIVNLINKLPVDHYRHSIICIVDHDKEFFKRIQRNDTEIFNLHKPDGKGLTWLYRCWKLLKKLQPDICHTRNLGSLEGQVAAFFANVKCRIHGEHGWCSSDIGGVNVKNQWIRRFFKPFVNHYVVLSMEAELYLINKVKVNSRDITRICNGVDIDKFEKSGGEINSCILDGNSPDFLKNKDAYTIFGTVGRLADVKNQALLLECFIAMVNENDKLRNTVALIIVGDGINMTLLRERAAEAGVENLIWFTGARSDIPNLLKLMDVFVLPSLAEGISNVILEAMACGLPIIATDVGGNPDLILPEHQDTHLISLDDAKKMKDCMTQYASNPGSSLMQSEKIKMHCQKNFRLEAMVEKYNQLYQRQSRKE